MKTLNFKHLFFGAFAILMAVCAGMSAAYGQTISHSTDGWAMYDSNGYVEALKSNKSGSKEFIYTLDSTSLNVAHGNHSDHLATLLQDSEILKIKVNYNNSTVKLIFMGQGQKYVYKTDLIYSEIAVGPEGEKSEDAAISMRFGDTTILFVDNSFYEPHEWTYPVAQLSVGNVFANLYGDGVVKNNVKQ